MHDSPDDLSGPSVWIESETRLADDRGRNPVGGPRNELSYEYEYESGNVNQNHKVL